MRWRHLQGDRRTVDGITRFGLRELADKVVVVLVVAGLINNNFRVGVAVSKDQDWVRGASIRTAVNTSHLIL